MIIEIVNVNYFDLVYSFKLSMSSELNEYIKNFLTDTLGLNTILTERAKNTSTGKNYIIYVENLNSYNEAESELLTKMIAALKINSEDLVVLDLSQINDNPQEVIMKIFLKDCPETLEETYSPRELLKNPNLKRKAWEDLKRLLTRL